MLRLSSVTWTNGFIMLIALICISSVAAASPFPRYEVIEPNVAFWTKIYSTYTTRQAVIHDSINLNIVYDVIELRPYKAPGARKVNRQRMKKAKARYKAILKQLAANPSNGNSECRRVAALFGPNAGGATFSRAARRIRSQIGQKDRFRKGLIRSGAYIDQIRTIFKSYGLPEDLAYLPHVESSFNNNAYSKFGAAGMWQFTRSTGKRYMKVGYELDERRDPIQATHAAARLLLDNYAKLQSWPLAITAYNHGAAGMAKAKRAHGDYAAIVKHYRGRTFKFASRNFYSEFLAALQVASDYPTYFGDIELNRPLDSQTVVLDAYAGLKELCAHFNVSPKVIKRLNPALRNPVFLGQKYVPKGYALRLPESVDASRTIPSKLFHHKQRPSYFYTVQRGDTAGKIARMHGVRLSDLILANNLNHRATIFPKQTLRIPRGDRTADSIKQTPTTLAARSKPAPPVQRNAVEPTITAAGGQQIYPQPALASIIPLSSPIKLKKSPAPTAVASVASGDLPSNEVVTVDVGFASIGEFNGLAAGLIQVEVEETLGHYADWAHVRTQKIRNMNGLRFGNPLHLHQKVHIPLTRVSAREFEEQRYEFHKRLQEDFFAMYTVNTTEPYRVRRGDNFWALCQQKFDVPMWLLANYNPEVDFADLRLNQKLLIPSVELKLSDDSEPMVPETSLSNVERRR